MVFSELPRAFARRIGLTNRDAPLGSVFRESFRRTLNFTRSLELGNSVLRKLHSGHAGDYVAWLSLGTALLGGLFVWFLG